MNKIETKITRDVDSDKVLNELRRYSSVDNATSYSNMLVPRLLLVEAEALICTLLDKEG